MLDGRRLRALDESQHDSADSLASPRLPCGRIWVVVQSHPGAERWAASNLLRSGYPVYLPLHAVTRRDPVTRSMTRTVELPLFVGYVFVQTTAGSPWTPIRYTQGVLRLLMSDGKPGHVDAGVLATLQATDAARRTVAPPGALYAAGEAVRLRAGALAGHQGVVISITPSHARVALVLLGGLRTVTVRLDALTRPAA
jgi:transcription antitermination factor NusG